MRERIMQISVCLLLCSLLVIALLSAMQRPAAPAISLYTIAPTTDDALTTETRPATTESLPVTPAVSMDLNTATAADLESVAGIGAVLAERIVAHRTMHGAFQRRTELLAIEGIGEVLAARILASFHIPGELPPLQTTAPVPQEKPVRTTTTTRLPVRPLLEMNAMTLADLLTVPGMTEAYAACILDFRTRIQYYSHPNELLIADGLPYDYAADILDCFYVAD